ncbi:MAG: flagellar biosynthesis protein FlhF [Zoogloeaceae bacterium]|jgi:flagellar biosynthesis protein FlhF|nr:flagellar biosynthesis protein FlhF [Zoogloeaceae bacterium]
MNVKKFVAANAGEALRKIKETLGQDATILSNRNLPGGGVEIMAVAARDIASVASPVEERGRMFAQRYQEEEQAYRVELSSRAMSQASDSLPPMHAPLISLAEHLEKRPEGRTVTRTGANPPRPVKKRSDPLVNAGIPMTASLRAALRPQTQKNASPAPSPSPSSSPSRPLAARNAPEIPAEVLLAEILSLRKIAEQQHLDLASFVWGETARRQPVKMEVLRRMLDAGFSPSFTRELLADLSPKMDFQQAYAWSRGMAEKHLVTAHADLVDKGGVYALTGPTGVGKTTTTAKLAARCVLRHGANRVALVTTDSYRIGAYEQLRIYGRILGVAVYLAKDAEELQQILGELQNKHMVLIDTMGMSQKDRLVAELNNMLSACGVRRLMLLPATVRGDTLDDVVRAYRGDDLAGCVLTKIDEATALAPAIDAMIRHGLRLDYVSNGQRVPEDLHLPNRTYLLHRAFKDLPEAAHRLAGPEPGLMMASAGFAANSGIERFARG